MMTLTRMLCSALLFSLVILWSPVETSSTTVLAASGTGSIMAGGNRTSLDGCPTSCGNLTFAYPFGVGADCSRSSDFSLICDDDDDDEGTTSRRPPKLFFRDGTTVVLQSIDVAFSGIQNSLSNNYIWASISGAIPMKSGVRVYNMSLRTPGRSFSYTFAIAVLNVTGCDLDVYWVDQMTGMTMSGCSTWCSGSSSGSGAGGQEEITEMAARYNCTGKGCCSVLVQDIWNRKSIELSFVHRKSGGGGSQLRDRITVTSRRTMLQWYLVDQPDCSAAKKNPTEYGCVSSHSGCRDTGVASFPGYLCGCEPGFTGNAYVIDGCTADNGYNQKESRANCTRHCGNIAVPFPFGLEDGCFSREQFHLFCTNATSPGVLRSNYLLLLKNVTGIDVNEGILNYTERKIDSFLGYDLFVSDGSFSSSMQWIVANLSCVEAKQNTSGYACVSINSRCVDVNTSSFRGYQYRGYRCKCSDGFEGNPYVQSGCQDIDECIQQDICKDRVCNNIEGSFKCIECPRNTVYDHANNRCTRTKQLVLLVGIIIGLSGGFSILLLGFVALFLFRRWKRNVQKQQRRNYFQKNQGLLLEQLASPDKTSIFSLEELEKATNNFDPTRIIGHGGHGMVYKGILSDQRVVAIKKSLVIQYSEIKQFINEVAILSEINHRNIVKLFGCCLESEVPLLVYDYISNGSLSQILHDESRNGVSLPWDDYIRIATEAAGALSYLHSAASMSVFHRDVKSSNILLDGNYIAKVSDFGASRLVPVDQTHISTNVQGTFGYLDPEYFHTRQLNEKSDVYSFGVVLLELLVRKKPVFTSESGLVQSLSNYFLEALKDKEITDIVDSQVVGEATKEEISSVASLAEMCLRLRGEERPTMKQVEMELQILRKKRVSSYQSGQENEQQNTTVLLARRAEAFAIQPCSSLEKEFMESATLPR